MTPSIVQTLHLFANLLPNWTLIPILTLLPNFGGFHGTLQRVRLANRGRLLLRTPGPVPFGTCICSNVETILSWTCHVYGPFEFRTSLGTSILLSKTIHDWHRSLRIVSYRAIIYASFSKRTPMTVYVSNKQVNNTLIAYIYWTPKETLQSCLLYYFIQCDYMAFLHLVKVVRDVFWGQMPNLILVQLSKTFVGRFERFARPARYLCFRVL